jgi:hypothetical protein
MHFQSCPYSTVLDMQVVPCLDVQARGSVVVSDTMIRGGKVAGSIFHEAI